jgi:hypothetical protein
MDPIQTVIIFVSVTLTTIIAILSIQVWNILKEFRISVHKMNGILDESTLSLQKVNKMLDDAGTVSGTVSQGVVQASGFLSGIRSGISMLSAFIPKKNYNEEKGGSHE